MKLQRKILNVDFKKDKKSQCVTQCPSIRTQIQVHIFVSATPRGTNIRHWLGLPGDSLGSCLHSSFVEAVEKRKTTDSTLPIPEHKKEE